MSKLWLLKGDLDADGWNVMRKDYEAEKVDILHLDPKVWAIVEADEPPTGYEGVTAVEPADGLYLDPNGSPMYIVGGVIVSSAKEVIDALGNRAQALLDQIGDADTVLEHMGRAY